MPHPLQPARPLRLRRKRQTGAPWWRRSRPRRRAPRRMAPGPGSSAASTRQPLLHASPTLRRAGCGSRRFCWASQATMPRRQRAGFTPFRSSVSWCCPTRPAATLPRQEPTIPRLRCSSSSAPTHPPTLSWSDTLRPWPWLDRLGLSALPSVLEPALGSRASPAAAAVATRLVVASEGEASAWRAVGARAGVVAPSRPARGATQALACCIDLGEVVEACRPVLGAAEDRTPPSRREAAARLGGLDRMDVLVEALDLPRGRERGYVGSSSRCTCPSWSAPASRSQWWATSMRWTSGSKPMASSSQAPCGTRHPFWPPRGWWSFPMRTPAAAQECWAPWRSASRLSRCPSWPPSCTGARQV